MDIMVNEEYFSFNDEPIIISSSSGSEDVLPAIDLTSYNEPIIICSSSEDELPAINFSSINEEPIVISDDEIIVISDMETPVFDLEPINHLTEDEIIYNPIYNFHDYHRYLATNPDNLYDDSVFDQEQHAEMMAKEILETIYLEEFLLSLRNLIKLECYGCEFDRPSQIDHDICLMMTPHEQMTMFFEKILYEGYIDDQVLYDLWLDRQGLISCENTFHNFLLLIQADIHLFEKLLNAWTS
ncbi:uncharacterized protein LOC117106269 isoform X2 [Anneissia japonica]|uniref:uncharacterized protein LOC117106269 isoform X1 n=1 Tax=Anneissia japonica TaxID=1529436 RepID=UPI001425AD1F|nr:uncharacterized protein LOC117106269 isoform X1 [Anneissia japonica]XP_033103521.1 uncharacterized protein LOC117106269 isoform X2 [Anneissia japonica]